MMRLESGKPYSLVELFHGRRRIIIPDLQRDYCWGTVKPDRANKPLAASFLQSLIELFEKGKGSLEQVSLGLVYAYENPANFVNIADGQQRLTTIYLLLCVLYRRLRKNSGVAKEIESFLCLDDTKTTKEPRLRYDVRESTAYFMKDYLNKIVFLDKAAQNLKRQGWFRQEYEADRRRGNA